MTDANLAAVQEHAPSFLCFEISQHSCSTNVISTTQTMVLKNN